MPVKYLICYFMIQQILWEIVGSSNWDYKRTHIHWSKICRLNLPNSVVPEHEWMVAEYVEGETVEKECITLIDSRYYLKPNYSSM